MPSVLSFNLVPATPFSSDELDELRTKLAGYPVYHDPTDDLYVLFGTPEELKETVPLYSRKTAPTFDVECFVQLRPDKLLVHPGSEGGIPHLREFVQWVLARGPHRLTRGNDELTIDQLMPPVGDLIL